MTEGYKKNQGLKALVPRISVGNPGDVARYPSLDAGVARRSRPAASACGWSLQRALTGVSKSRRGKNGEGDEGEHSSEPGSDWLAFVLNALVHVDPTMVAELLLSTNNGNIATGSNSTRGTCK